MLGKLQVYMCLHITSIKFTAGNRNRPFPCPLLICTSRFLILAKSFRNDHVVACGTTLRSATEKNEMGGNVTIPCLAKVTQRGSTA